MSMDSEKLKKANPRMEAERNIWMATVRPDGRPHLVPIWFVWLDNLIWICTPNDSVKTKNLRANSNMSASLEDGNSTVIFEGTSTILTVDDTPQPVLDAFISKYEWDISTDDEAEYILIRMEPVKLLSWNL